MQSCKRKDFFIKDYITTYINSSSRNIQALKAFMKRAISMKDTPLRTKFQFSRVEGSNIRPTGTPKHSKRRVIRDFV
jgi:hypothetical protein